MYREIRKRAQLYGVVAVVSAILLGAFVYSFRIYQQESQPPAQLLLRTFSSYDELRSFLLENSETQGAFPFYGPVDVNVLRLSPAEFASAQSLKYSTTNVQVAGVDEADIVKTDGEHIFFASGNSVYILKAYPPEEAEVLSNITFSNMYPVGIFVSGDRLTVLGSKYTIPSPSYYQAFVVDIKTFVNVYDISDKASPVLLKNFTMSGSYFNSRMIGDYVYTVVSQPAYVIYDTVILPKIYSNDGIKEIGASEIHYSNVSNNYFMFTTVVALNMQNVTEDPTYMTLMLGGTSSMYVSLDSIYITFPEPDEKTSIYRIRIEKSTISPEAHGKVPGHELNQFSMDEYNNYFRIATATWVNGTAQSNVYALNMDLEMVGTLENIAPGETLDSARFIGNRCYLSTSIVRKDPFFVIDVENASDLKILGYLKIPGFNRYLHPYDETHIIGIGKDETNKVKTSLFDVSNVSAPVEIGNYTVSGDWSDTLVLTEHKAFLFDRPKDLLAIPVSIYDGDTYSLWQGAYVFNITLTDGLALKGNVTHQEAGANEWDSSYWVKRSLYIENVLYTMSDKKIKMNSLEDLTQINKIELP